MKLRSSENGNYTLENAEGDTISLSTDEVAELAQAARRIWRHLRSGDPQGSKYSAISSETPSVTLGIDAHHTYVLLKFDFADGTQEAYEIPAENVKAMQEGLARKLEMIEAAAKAAQRH